MQFTIANRLPRGSAPHTTWSPSRSADRQVVDDHVGTGLLQDPDDLVGRAPAPSRRPFFCLPSRRASSRARLCDARLRHVGELDCVVRVRPDRVERSGADLPLDASNAAVNSMSETWYPPRSMCMSPGTLAAGLASLSTRLPGGASWRSCRADDATAPCPSSATCRSASRSARPWDGPFPAAAEGHGPPRSSRRGCRSRPRARGRSRRSCSTRSGRPRPGSPLELLRHPEEDDRARAGACSCGRSAAYATPRCSASIPTATSLRLTPRRAVSRTSAP